MTQACRDALMDIKYNEAAHSGLLLAKYLKAVAGDKKNHPEARKKLLQASQQATKKVSTLYAMAFDRRCVSLAQTGELEYGVFKTVGRLIIGLGSESALETGITLHHTYGVPVIPGSALKGLAAHYCDQVWGEENKEFKKTGVEDRDKHGREIIRQGEYHSVLFGANDDSGYIVFHDAWIMPESVNQGLVPDVMTPHHSDYYEGKTVNGRPSAPTDFDDPNPISFLSVTGLFHIALSCDVAGKQGREWAGLAMTLLTQALNRWGCGGKTSSGYGRLNLNDGATGRLRKKLIEESRKREEERKRKEEEIILQKRLSGLSPIAQKFERVAHSCKFRENKNAFDRQIAGWLDQIAGDPQPDAVQAIARLVRHHFTGLLENPNATHGKKNKANFSDRQKRIAEKLNALMSQKFGHPPHEEKT